MPYDCNCKAITPTHTKAALGKCNPPPQTTEELYSLALGVKLSDPNARRTGLEAVNNNGFNCGRCRSVFEAAVSSPAAESASSNRIIIAIQPEGQKKTGKCGNDCNTCSPQTIEAAGCAPVRT